MTSGAHRFLSQGCETDILQLDVSNILTDDTAAFSLPPDELGPHDAPEDRASWELVDGVSWIRRSSLAPAPRAVLLRR